MAQILAADRMMTRKWEGEVRSYKTIEERNAATMEMMTFSNVPNFTWNINSENGDITVTSEEQPLSVSVFALQSSFLYFF